MKLVYNKLWKVATACVLCLLLITGCVQEAGQDKTSDQSAGTEKLKVAVSILPQEAMVKAVAGDLVDIVTIIPPGGSPANYQPTPKQMQAFGDAEIYFSIGVPTEAANIFPNMVDDRDDLMVVRLEEAVEEVYPLRFFGEDELHSHDEEHEDDHDHDEHADEEDHDHEEYTDEEDGHIDDDGHHDHSGMDPHLWMSPRRMVVMTEAVAATLSELDPTNQATYEANRDAFIAELEAADKSLMETFEGVENTSFIIMHPSMGYFADDYGLKQVALEQDGKASSAARLGEVIDFALDNEIRVVFYQAEFDSAQSKTLAQEIGGQVMELEVLSPDYINNIKAIEETFQKILN